MSSIFYKDGEKLGLPIEILDYPLKNSKFLTFPASESKHHCWYGGLLTHTEEVYKCAKAQWSLFKSESFLDSSVLLLASLYHDFGKIYDYNVSFDEGAIMGVDKTDHYSKIRHISESFSMFREKVKEINKIKNTCLSDKIILEVEHCILSHHGKLEHGSPVEPDTNLAWCVHLADMASVNVSQKAWKNWEKKK